MSRAKLVVHYVPSEKPQKLEIRYKVEAKRIAHTSDYYQPLLYAKGWTDLINAGLAAGDRFDPAKSSAKVVSELEPMTELGVHEQKLVLQVAGVAPEFLRLLARALLQSRFGNPTLHSTMPNADFRIKELEIRGSVEGTSAVDAATLEAWIDDDTVQLGSFAEPVPFELEVKTGKLPWLFIEPREKLTKKGFERVEKVVESWLRMTIVWPNGGNEPGGIELIVRKRDMFGGFESVGDTLDWELKTVTRIPFPYAPSVVEAALRNAMRALHATVPLKKVVVTFPGAGTDKAAFPFPYFGHYEISDSGADGFYWAVRFAKAPPNKDRVGIARALLPTLSNGVYVQREEWPWRWDDDRLVICADEHPKAPAETSPKRVGAKKALDKALVDVHKKWPIAEVFAIGGESPTGSEWDTWSRRNGKPSMKGTAVFRKGEPDAAVEGMRVGEPASKAKDAPTKDKAKARTTKPKAKQ